MSNQPLLNETPSRTNAADIAGTRVITGSDYLASFPLEVAAPRRDGPAAAPLQGRTSLHALRGAVPK